MIRIAIMQPYVFPYIGYFQLIKAVDVFVFYDDVNFIKQGWVNRNRVMMNDEACLFSVPVKNISSFTEIRDTKIHLTLYEVWRKKFLKSLQQNYGKAPYFQEVFSMIENVLFRKNESISELAIDSISTVCDFLGVNTQFKISSRDYGDSKGYGRLDRIRSICKQENGNEYINPIGGKELYDKDVFLPEHIQLFFIETSSRINYYQGKQNKFIPSLSIIDVMMWNNKAEITGMLDDFTLI